MFAADTDMDAVLAGLPEEASGSARARIEILEDKDWERAAGFLDMRYLPEDFDWEPVDLLDALRVVWSSSLAA